MGGWRRALPFLLGGACSLAVALFGTLPGWAIALAALLFSAAAAIVVFVARHEPVALGEVPVALLAITAWTALTLLPLPVGWVERIAPDSVTDARQTADALGDDAPTLAALTRSPSDTRRELVKAAAIAAAFVGGLVLAQIRGRRTAVLAAASGAVTAAVITVLHVIADADRVYGIYEFPWPPSLLGPIGNQNHLSGFTAMAVPALVGVALDLEDRRRRSALLGTAAFCGAVALAAISRGGTGALVLGLIVLAILVVRRSRRTGDKEAARRGFIALGVVSIVGVLLAFVAYSFGESLARDFGASSTGKLELAAEGLVLVGESPWLGVGRGAFRVAYTHLFTGDRMYFPENLLVQWVTEWGVPATLLLLVTLGAAWTSAARRAESATQMGALSAVLAMFAHDQVDFALENLAIAGCTAVLFAAAIARTERKLETAVPTRRDHVVRWAAPIAGVSLALLLGWGLYRADARRLERVIFEMHDAGDRDGAEALGRDAMRMHPSEPVFPLLLGWIAATHDERDAPRWLNRAMLLAPDWPSPHLVVARWLARQGRIEQAWLEVREAERVAPRSGSREMCLFVAAEDDPEVPRRVFAGEPSRDEILGRAAACPDIAPEMADALDRALVADATGEIDGEARVRLARRALRLHHPEEALALLDGAEASTWSVRLTRAETLMALDRAPDAIAALEGRAPVAIEPRRLETLARAHAAAGDAEAMRATMLLLRSFAAGSGPRLAENAVTLGRLEEELGNTGRAHAAYDEASRLDPASPGLARDAALSEREGDLRRAYLAFTELCRSEGEGSRSCTAAARVSARMERRE